MPNENNTNSAKRLEALNKALEQIDKNFGKGSIMRMGDVEKKNVPVIPTSSLALDIALGIGGVPRGRVIEIYGPEASGKCLTADTLVPTNWGVLSLTEIFERCDMQASCTSRVTDITSYGLKVINQYGQPETVTHLTHNNRRPVLEITSTAGKTVKVTENHPMRILDENGWLVWRNASELKTGDTLIGVLGGFSDVDDKITVEEATLLGYLVGDGHYSPPNRVMFSQVDEETSEEFNALMLGMFPDLAGKVYEGRPNDTWFNSKAARTTLLEKGLVHTTAPTKTVPWTVRASGHAVQKAFLSALFECDGGVENSNICLSTASKQLATEVQVMLAGLGLVSSVRPKKVAAYPDNTYYTVTLGSASSKAFLDVVGFRSERRADQVANAKLGDKDALRHIPNLKNYIRTLRDTVGGDREFADIADGVFRTWGDGLNDLRVTAQTIDKLIDWAERNNAGTHPLTQHLRTLRDLPATYETITSITPIGEEPTFDLVVPGSHSFVANGLAAHNTTLTLHLAANCQKQGGTVAFIDAEHALDPIYAENLGVDVANLLISQPDTGEQALDIADMLIRSGAVDLVIVDSVAALVPRAEIEGDMGDSHVGLQARLMSQALRKITGGLNQTDTTIVFINQLREKIGVMFGCFDYDSLITLADGTSKPIGQIVADKEPVEVLSYDFETGSVVSRPVTGWYNNGPAPEFLTVTVANPGNTSTASMTVTSNHKVMTPGGWEEAGLLETGDDVCYVENNELVKGIVTSIESAPETDNMDRFDIRVDEAHNYFADGVLVHNSPETTTGGKALKFYASVRMDIRRIETLKEGTEAVGNRTRVKVVKNKMSAPFRQAEFDIIYGEGISYEGGLIDMGVEYNIVRKSGSWYTYEGDQLGQGKEKARQFLKDNPEMCDELDHLIRVHAGLVEEDDVPEAPKAPKAPAAPKEEE